MKSNVDLTENRVFHKKTLSVLDSIHLYFRKTLKKNIYPWSHRLSSLTYGKFEKVFPTGSRRERKGKKQDFHGYEHCDRCGFDFSKKKWYASHSGLCLNCDKELREEVREETNRRKKYPWQFQPQTSARLPS